MNEVREVIVRWLWSHDGGGRPVQVECMLTGRDNHLFIIDASDVQGGRVVYRGGLFETEAACWDHEVDEAVKRVKNAEERLADLKRFRTLREGK